MIIGIVLYAIATVVGIKAVFSIFRSFIQPDIALTGAAGAIGFLADKVSGGDNSKVKSLDKDPLKNPDIEDSKNIPVEMGKAGIGVFNPIRMASTTGTPMGGIALNTMIDSANQVQNGQIVTNKAKQIRGPIYQGGAAVFTRTKGLRGDINQSAGNLLNQTVGGKPKFLQGENNRNYINRGRLSMNQPGESFTTMNGGTARISAPYGTLNMENLTPKRITGVQTLVAGNFYAPKGTKMKMLAAAMGPNALDGYNPNIMVALNDMQLQRITGYNLNTNKRYHANTNQQLVMMGLRNVYADPANQALSRGEKAKLYTINRVRQSNMLASGDSNVYSMEANRRKNDYDELYRMMVRTVPELSAAQMTQVANRVNELRAGRDRSQRMLAREKADSRMNLDNANMNSLNNILRQTSKASEHFNSFLNENFQDDPARELSESEIKEIEQKARENVEAREGLALEDFEKEYEEERDKLIGEKQDEKMEELEERIKEEIISDPERAEEILGEEGAKLLKEEFRKNSKKKEDMYQQILRKQSKADDENFRLRHEEYKNASYYEIHKARMQEQTRQDIQTAAGELKEKQKDEDNNTMPRGVFIRMPQSQQLNAGQG